MTRRTFFVTPAAGAWVAGVRVELLAPGASGAVELELSDDQAAAELRTGALSETPPEAGAIAGSENIASEAPPAAAAALRLPAPAKKGQRQPAPGLA